MTSRREGEQRLSPGRSSAQQSAPGGKFFLLVCSCRARVYRPFAGMSSSSCGAQCSLHLLKFAEIDGFEEDTPDVSDLLAEFKGGKCQARITRGNTVSRVPLCNEDVQAMQRAGLGDLFDSELFLTGVCPRHAEMLLSRAVEGRACAGERIHL